MYKKHLDAQQQIYLEKAVQFYLFSGQREITKLPDAVQERFRNSRRVAYSLIKTFITESEFKPEYMQYLNDELNELRNLPPGMQKELLIAPSQLHEIELSQKLQIGFDDEESGEWELRFNRKTNELFHSLKRDS
ncbi:MAG TPA: hypothetical protein VKM36_01840 [Balneolaceae bacterium]|nr:hypothetical protein [Balneolaceae bacterium]